MNQKLLVGVCGLCAFLGGGVSLMLMHRLESSAFAEPRVADALAGGDSLRVSDRFEAIARKMSPTVVSVEAVKPPATGAAGTGRTKPVEESGSGVLVRMEGQGSAFVVTNNHVVAGAAPAQIHISLDDGRLFRPDRVWADPESDVALLRVEADNLPTATLGNSDKARVGQWVLAFGSPFGLSQTVTHGILSARERGQVSLGGTIRIKDFLQTDAAINPGSSGGPLVNMDGEVIGINTAIASHSGSNSGVAFSIPINLVKSVCRQLMERGTVARGYLGIQLSSTFEAADALRVGLDRVRGALVDRVFPDSPASISGIRQNDVILQIDDTAIRGENHLINWISSLKAGQKVRIVVWRDRQTLSIQTTVGDWSKEQARFKSDP